MKFLFTLQLFFSLYLIPLAGTLMFILFSSQVFNDSAASRISSPFYRLSAISLLFFIFVYAITRLQSSLNSRFNMRIVHEKDNKERRHEENGSCDRRNDDSR